MDTTRYTIRPFEDSDYEATVRIFAEDGPGLVETPHELRRRDSLREGDSGHFSLRLAVQDRPSREVVACGSLATSLHTFHPQKFWIAALVDRAHRREGLGDALYNELERAAVGRRAITLWSGYKEGDRAGSTFFEKHQFVEGERIWTSRLDLAGTGSTLLGNDLPTREFEGIRVTTLPAEGPHRPEVRRRLYALSLVISPDAPRMGDYTPSSFEEFVRNEIESTAYVTDGYFLAVAGDEFVGMTSLEKDGDRPDTLRIGFTGTHPNFRGRGIATELKRRAIRFARDRGYRFLVTNNNSLNQPIWAINEKLGFRREQTWVQGAKELR
jgi:mycothiol synthase